MNSLLEHIASVPVQTSAIVTRVRIHRSPAEEVFPGGSDWFRINAPPRRTPRVPPLTLHNSNYTNLPNNASGSRINHKNRNRENEFKDYECCPECYCSELVMLCASHNLPVLEVEPLEKPMPPNNTVRPLEAYVKETDEVIKNLLAEIAEREMDTE